MATERTSVASEGKVNKPKTSSKCSMCKDDLSLSKLLPCHHSFCTECLCFQHLTNLQSGKEFCCPTCLLHIGLEHNHVENLPSNFLLDILDEYFGKTSTNQNCSSCAVVEKEEVSTHKCLDCGDALCKPCSEFHCRPKSTRHHMVVPLEDAISNTTGEELKTRKKVHCEKHFASGDPQFMTHFCETCRGLVCLMCIINDHDGHTFKEIQVSSKIKRDILLKRAKGDKSLRKQQVENAICSLKKEYQEQEDFIIEKATGLYELIDKVKEEKLSELKKHYDEAIKSLQTILDEESNVEKRFESSSNFVQDFTEFSSNIDFLQHELVVNSRFDEIQQRESRSFTIMSLTLESVTAESIMNKLQSVFGKIRKTNICKMFKCELKKPCLISIYECWFSYRICAQASGENGCVAISTPHTKTRNIAYFDADSLGSVTLYTLPEVKRPSDIYATKNDCYVSDTGDKTKRIVKMDQKKNLLKIWKLPESENGNSHLGVCVNSKKEVFISTVSKVYKCAPDETHPREFLDLQSQHPVEKVFMCMTPGDNLVVSGHGSKTQVFDIVGKLVTEYEGSEFGITNPCQVTSDDDGFIYIADQHVRRIMVVKDGKTTGIIDSNNLLCDSDNRSFDISKDDHLMLCDGKTVGKFKIWTSTF